MRGLGRSLAMIRLEYGWWGDVAALAFIAFGVWCVFGLPRAIENYRWWRIERDIRKAK